MLNVLLMLLILLSAQLSTTSDAKQIAATKQKPTSTPTCAPGLVCN